MSDAKVTGVASSNNFAGMDANIKADSASRAYSRRVRDTDYWKSWAAERLKDCELLKGKYKELIETIDAYTFKQGDVVVVKGKGNGIVVGIGVGEESMAIDDAFADRFFVEVTTKDGLIRVTPADIMPYTVASKVLYERS